MNKSDFIEALKKRSACDETIRWCLKTDADTAQELWDKCERGDWMLWLIWRKIDVSNESALRRLTATKAKCARLVIHLMQDDRSKKAVEVAESFGRGKATREELDAACTDARGAGTDVCLTCGDCSDLNTCNVAIYASALTACASACAFAYASVAGMEFLKQCADIVRKDWPSIDEIMDARKAGES